MRITEDRLLDACCKPKNETELNQLIQLAKRYNGSSPFFDESTENNTYIRGKPCFYYDPNGYFMLNYHYQDRSFIPVSWFIDLLEDRITEWRIEEDGFEKSKQKIETSSYDLGYVTVTFADGNPYVTIPDHGQSFSNKDCNVETYTELIQLVKMIG